MTPTSSPTAVPTAEPSIARPGWSVARPTLELAASLAVGLLLLSPGWSLLLGPAAARPDLFILTAAADMAAAATVWLLYRGHRPGRVAAVAVAILLPGPVLLVPFRLGLLTGRRLVPVALVLTLVAVTVILLLRRAALPGVLGDARRAHPLIDTLGRRWPTWVGLAMVADNWLDPAVPAPWIMLVLPGGYLLIGGIRGRLRDRRMLLVQLAGLAGYLALILAAVGSGPMVAGWLVVAGWAAHAVWDAVHHRAGAVVPRGYAEWCGVIDAVIALTAALLLSDIASPR